MDEPVLKEPFVPRRKNFQENFILPLALPRNLKLDIDDISKRTGIPRQEIIRQMIYHCLRNIVIEPQPMEDKKPHDISKYKKPK